MHCAQAKGCMPEGDDSSFLQTEVKADGSIMAEVRAHDKQMRSDSGSGLSAEELERRKKMRDELFDMTEAVESRMQRRHAAIIEGATRMQQYKEVLAAFNQKSKEITDSKDEEHIKAAKLDQVNQALIQLSLHLQADVINPEFNLGKK